MARSDFRETLATVDDLPAGTVITAEWDESQGVLGRVPQPADDAYAVTPAACRTAWRQEMLLWTMGHYDMVAVYDMPSDEAFASLILQVGGAGMLRTEGLRGFAAEEIGTILGNGK